MKSTPLPSKVPRSFDQIVKGDVFIKKLKANKKYKITFSKINKFLMCQVWDEENNDNRNDERVVFRVTAREWVEFIKTVNEILSKNNQPLFTPTTIIETEDGEQFVCVIHKVYFDKNDRLVFIVSTKEIKLANYCSKNLIDIPCGKFTNMRFDIPPLVLQQGLGYEVGLLRTESFNLWASLACGGALGGILCGWLFMQ